MKTFYWLLLLMLFTSCSIFDGNCSSKIDLGRSWELVEFVDSSGETVLLIDHETHTLRFAEDMVLGGEAACNQYGGEYRAEKDGDLIIKNLFITEIACQQPSLCEEFVDALTHVSKFSSNQGRLILFFNDDGMMTFSERLE